MQTPALLCRIDCWPEQAKAALLWIPCWVLYVQWQQFSRRPRSCKTGNLSWLLPMRVRAFHSVHLPSVWAGKPVVILEACYKVAFKVRLGTPPPHMILGVVPWQHGPSFASIAFHL